MHALRTALLVTAMLAPAAALARPMTPEDVARIEYAGNFAISSDGSRIAYTTVSRPDVTQGEENGGATQQLFLADGPMEARAYLPEDVDVSGVGFTPDGSMITYIWADGDEDAALWGVPVEGGAPRKLAAVADTNLRSYAFAPSGESVYLLVGPGPDEVRDSESEAGFTARVYEEEERFARLFVAATGTAEIDPEPRAVEVPEHVDSIQISRDGTLMVLTSAPSTLVDASYTSRRPYLLDLPTGEVRAIETLGKIGDIEIAPDSRTLSLLAAVDASDPAPTTLHLVDVATGAFTPVNAGAAEAVVDTEWMADGRLAAIVHVGAQSVLRFYSADGDVLREYDPGALILSSLEQGGNRLIADASAPTHPWELFQFDGQGFERLTQHNPWLSQIDFGEQRTLTYTARDGQEIEGILIEPVGGVDFGGSPLILDVHGGPEAHESNGWVTGYSSPGQVAAGQGYAVFLPNYRGSTAYGTEFSRQHQYDAAGKEFDDLVDAKAALAEMGLVDPARVGITGGSYGGYATAWSATRYSEEFAAGVMFVGISNILSKYGTTDIPTEEYLVHAREYPWEDYMDTLRRSPIYYADQADTPLLILHGDADPRVSPTQSLELYRQIKVRRPDTPVRLVLYPGEGHGNAMAAARYDYNLRMMRWFETYLKTGDRDAPLPDPRPELNLPDGEQ